MSHHYPVAIPPHRALQDAADAVGLRPDLRHRVAATGPGGVELTTGGRWISQEDRDAAEEDLELSELLMPRGLDLVDLFEAGGAR